MFFQKNGVMFICNMFLRGNNSMLMVVSYKSLKYLIELWKPIDFQKKDTSHPLHVNLSNMIIQHIEGPWFYYAMKKNLETHIGGELH